jgi:hypothetical protein
MTSDVSPSLDSTDIEVSGLQKKQTRLKEELNLKLLFGLVCPTTFKEMKVESIIPPSVLIAENECKNELHRLKVLSVSLIQQMFVIKTHSGTYTMIPFVYPGHNSCAPSQTCMKSFYYCREWVVTLGEKDPNLLFRWEALASCVFQQKRGMHHRVFISMTLLRSNIKALDCTFILACCMMTLCKDHRMDWHVIEISSGRHYIWEGLFIIQHTWCDLLGEFNVQAAKTGVAYYRKHNSIQYDDKRGLARPIKNPLNLRNPDFCDRGKNNDELNQEWNKCFVVEEDETRQPRKCTETKAKPISKYTLYIIILMYVLV